MPILIAPSDSTTTAYMHVAADNEGDRGILNVPDFWKREETGFGSDFLHFGSNSYWLGNYTRSGPAPNQTSFVPTTPQQQFGPGPNEGHGYFSSMLKKFVWFGWIPGSPPAEEVCLCAITGDRQGLITDYFILVQFILIVRLSI